MDIDFGFAWILALLMLHSLAKAHCFSVLKYQELLAFNWKLLHTYCQLWYCKKSRFRFQFLNFHWEIQFSLKIVLLLKLMLAEISIDLSNMCFVVRLSFKFRLIRNFHQILDSFLQQQLKMSWSFHQLLDFMEHYLRIHHHRRILLLDFSYRISYRQISCCPFADYLGYQSHLLPFQGFSSSCQILHHCYRISFLDFKVVVGRSHLLRTYFVLNY